MVSVDVRPMFFFLSLSLARHRHFPPSPSLYLLSSLSLCSFPPLLSLPDCGVPLTQKLRSARLRIQNHQRFSLAKPGVGQNTVTYATPAARNSAFSVSAFSVCSTSFSQSSANKQVTCGVSSEFELLHVILLVLCFDLLQPSCLTWC